MGAWFFTIREITNVKIWEIKINPVVLELKESASTGVRQIERNGVKIVWLEIEADVSVYLCVYVWAHIAFIVSIPRA